MKQTLQELKEKAIVFETTRAFELEGLQHKERILKALIDNVDEAVAIHDGKGFIECNQKFLDILQVTAKNLFKKPGFDFIIPKDVEKVRKLMDIKSTKMQQYKTEYIGLKGKRTPVNVKAQWIKTNGTYHRLIIVTTEYL